MVSILKKTIFHHFFCSQVLVEVNMVKLGANVKYLFPKQSVTSSFRELAFAILSSLAHFLTTNTHAWYEREMH